MKRTSMFLIATLISITGCTSQPYPSDEKNVAIKMCECKKAYDYDCQRWLTMDTLRPYIDRNEASHEQYLKDIEEAQGEKKKKLLEHQKRKKDKRDKIYCNQMEIFSNEFTSAQAEVPSTGKSPYSISMLLGKEVMDKDWKVQSVKYGF